MYHKFVLAQPINRVGMYVCIALQLAVAAMSTAVMLFMLCGEYVWRVPVAKMAFAVTLWRFLDVFMKMYYNLPVPGLANLLHFLTLAVIFPAYVCRRCGVPTSFLLRIPWHGWRIVWMVVAQALSQAVLRNYTTYRDQVRQ